MSTKSLSGKRDSISSTAARFMLGSSRTAVCGQAPVSTPRIRSSSKMPLSVRWTCLASSVVTISLVIIRTLTPILTKMGVMASMIAVLPEPTGPPTPIRVIFFMSCSGDSVHKHAYVRLDMRGCHDVERGRECCHVVKCGPRDAFVFGFCGGVDLEENGLCVEVMNLHEPQRRAQDHARRAVLQYGKGLALRQSESGEQQAQTDRIGAWGFLPFDVPQPVRQQRRMEQAARQLA